ncbi:Cro/Cl family transcriptional regulator [Acinetobacter sp. TUM15064]|uniref:Cro/Cl family transcriptional regulator n=1 Tax=Acinetobacter sp. TUM15064 TaxID=2609134 RepID=UPI001C072D7A|nr:Cro/Cl family transcriptional regulator [Acinetobacter sp. TUM15064]
MTLDEAKKKLNCKKSKDLAALLEISPEAVSQWNPECIPKRREYEVLEKELLLGLVHKQTVNQNFAESNV